MRGSKALRIATTLQWEARKPCAEEEEENAKEEEEEEEEEGRRRIRRRRRRRWRKKKKKEYYIYGERWFFKQFTISVFNMTNDKEMIKHNPLKHFRCLHLIIVTSLLDMYYFFWTLKVTFAKYVKIWKYKTF